VKRVDSAVDQITRESFQFGRHEEPTTSMLLQAINSAFRSDPVTAGPLALKVHAETFTRPQESHAGADVYVSLVREDLILPRSKGMLIQAKRRTALSKSGEPQRLGAQCKRMYRRSHASYVWIYEEHGITCGDAPQASQPLFTRVSNPTTVGELLADGLRCNRGDEGIGRNIALPLHVGVPKVVRDLAIPHALELDVINS